MGKRPSEWTWTDYVEFLIPRHTLFNVEMVYVFDRLIERVEILLPSAPVIWVVNRSVW
jgi:hypothetical protein